MWCFSGVPIALCHAKPMATFPLILSQVLDVSITLIMVTVSRVFSYVQIHQVVDIKYLQFFVYELCLNKTVF